MNRSKRGIEPIGEARALWPKSHNPFAAIAI